MSRLQWQLSPPAASFLKLRFQLTTFVTPVNAAQRRQAPTNLISQLASNIVGELMEALSDDH